MTTLIVFVDEVEADEEEINRSRSLIWKRYRTSLQILTLLLTQSNLVTHVSHYFKVRNNDKSWLTFRKAEILKRYVQMLLIEEKNKWFERLKETIYMLHGLS